MSKQQMNTESSHANEVSSAKAMSPVPTLWGPGNKDVLEQTGTEEERVRRLQALLSQWLRMENVVGLLGAGASKGQGGALMYDLEEFVLTESLKLLEEDAHSKAAKAIIQHRKDVLGPKPSFESWLGFLSGLHHLLETTGSPLQSGLLQTQFVADSAIVTRETLDILIRIVNHLIFVRCSLTLPDLVSKAPGAEHENSVTAQHAFLAKLVTRDPALGRAHLFTTNYDTLLEQAMDDLAIRYCDGFVGNVDRRFDPSGYGLDLYYPGEVAEGRVRRFDKFLHLYKLHGSIDWQRKRDGTVIRAAGSNGTLDWNAWGEKDDNEKRKWATTALCSELPLGIMPTEVKLSQTLAMPYAHLFRALHQRLQVPQTFLIVIGYGFGDDHINSLITDAMTNPSLVLLVVSPHKPNDDLMRRLKGYWLAGERAFLLNSTFEDFAQTYLPNVAWIGDQMRMLKAERELRAIDNNDNDGDADGTN